MPLTPRFVSDDMKTLKRAAVNGVGIVALPGYVCREELGSGSLRRVLPDWKADDSTLTALMPNRQGVLPSVRAFVSLDAYSKRWLKNRERVGVRSWKDDESRLRHHVLPFLGKMALDDVQPRHVNEVVQRLRAAKKAPRTVRNVYSVVAALFRDAQIDGLISRTPCILTKYQLGKIGDAKHEWDELQKLIGDERVPWDRRVFYALLGLGMLRHGEAAGLRWRHVVKMEPLSRLIIATSYDTGDTKTSVERWMPVHPVLAAMLAEWKLRGWREQMERAPGADDLVVPTPKPTNHGPRVPLGSMRDDHYTYKRMIADTAMLGLRHRRVHDLRRTGITLAREDGAERDVLRLCTHGAGRDVMELYTTFGWSRLCGQVSCIKIERSPHSAPKAEVPVST